MIPRLAVLLSGSGSTLQNLIDRIADGRLSASIVGVVSSRADAFGLERARRAGIPTATVPKKALTPGPSPSDVPAGRELGRGGEESSTLSRRAEGEDRRERVVAQRPGEGLLPVSHSDTVFAAVRPWQPDFVVLAGWIHLLHIPDDFALKVVNVHPSLLPAFGGKGMYGPNVHRAVLASGARVSGCTVHFADDTYDTGPIIHQAVVPVLDADTPEELAERVQAAEREAYPDALAKLAAGGWRVMGKRVVWG